MKKLGLLIVFTVFLGMNAFAGGPVTAPSLDEVSGSKPVEKAKTAVVQYAYDDFSKVSKHWTVGLGLGGNPLVGMVEKDGFGYPKVEYGFSCVLGIGYAWISGQPTQKEIQGALDSIASKRGAVVNEKELPSLVREELGNKPLDYFQIGTVALVVPLNVEVGKMYIINDNLRARLGFGLPTLICFGINYDF
jgi:hypothetical protein